MNPDPSGSQTAFNSSLPMPSSSTPPSRAQKAALPPLHVPPRSESLPFPSSPTSSSSDTLPPTGARPFQHKHSDSVTSINSYSTKPLSVNPRKPSTAEIYYPETKAQPGQLYRPGSTTTPQPASTGFARAPSPQLSTSLNTSPQLTPPPPVNNNSLLSVLNDGRGQPLSRESRITLPDEARQYIAAMGESPVPSPRIDAFAQRIPPNSLDRGLSGHSSRQLASGASSKSSLHEAKGEFLDMDDEDTAEDEEDIEGDGYEIVEPPVSPSLQPGNPHPMSLHQQHQYAPAQPPALTRPPLSPTDSFQGKKSKSRAAAEDFPLPPSTSDVQSSQAYMHATTFAQQQAHIQSDLQVRAAAIAAAEAAHQHAILNGTDRNTDYTDLDTDTDTLASNNPPQPQFVAQLQPKRPDFEPQNLPANFRALPLLSSDLPHTTINVSHSFVRPNDRGKEVLSFVIHVNPGHGKEIWRVEKMYSDVLGLDQRVRSSVGKGVGKKIANLPEGKLWKDHAPAKVDQRKVRPL